MVALYIALALFVLYLAYQIPQIKYYTKFIIFCNSISIGAILYAPYLSYFGRSYENAWRFKRMFWLSGRLIGLNAIIRDAKYFTPEQPCIYVANHQSCIDFFSLAPLWPKRCTVVSKTSVKFAGPVGFSAWLSKLIFIDRSKHKDAISVMKHAAQEASKDQVSVYVFPEGTRSDKNTIIPFKKGAFHLAVNCQFPIQPIVISSYNRFLDHKNKRFDSGTVYVQVLPKINTTGKTAADVNQLMEETHRVMLDCFEELKKLPIEP